MFRLAKVLQWKERLEEDARGRRLDVEGRAADLERDMTRLRAERAAFPDAVSGDHVIRDLAAWAKRSELLRRNEQSLRKRRAALQAELETRRAEHLAIRQEVESLRKLRERRREEEAQLRERRSQEMTDEAAARRFLPGGGRKFPRSS
jgi:flagellar export protein FliJ